MSSSTQTTYSLDPLAETSRYTKVEDHSSNATGVLQLARNTETGQLVAIQVIERGTHIGSLLKADILNHRSLRHPHVIKFQEAFNTTEHLCIVMEHADAGSLASYVKARGRLKEAAARWLFQQLIIALDYCHRCGVFNNNIRLENMLLKTVQGIPLPLLKICDFEYLKAQAPSRPPAIVSSHTSQGGGGGHLTWQMV
jgi:serine/threonine-protein kinase SRK2